MLDTYQEFIHMSRYSRWLEEEKRRESWEETVRRYVTFMQGHVLENLGAEIPRSDWHSIYEGVLDLKAFPSMRSLMTAGPALERCNVAGYNCAYTAIDSERAFREVLYILMCGTGVGFSVENQYVNKLPHIPQIMRSREVIPVSDSKEGWAAAYGILINRLFKGESPTWDVTALRPAGARLKTFGGRSSGPDPLVDLFKYTTEMFKRSQGRQLSALEVHDIICKIGSVVVVGGVRRSALISLSDLKDIDMANSKTLENLEGNAQRYLANNSVAYSHRPSLEEFVKECEALYLSKSGERGFFNREAAQAQSARFGRDASHDFGTNPCSEIILRNKQFCNLTTIVVRPEDTPESLAQKARLAAIMGTTQASLVDFRFLDDKWRENCAEERLLGVSMTGIFGNTLLSGADGDAARSSVLRDLRDYTREINQEYASMLGIPAAAAVTTVKPEGTTSELANCSSGMHPAFARYYIRTVRGDIKDPLTRFLQDAGVPNEPDVVNDQNVVFSFPKQSPADAILADDLSAISHMETCLAFQRDWCEHKPSVTINVGEDEWRDVFKWTWNHFDEGSGMAFLPRQDHIYAQAPFQKIDQETHDSLSSQMPSIDWSILQHYETEDTTKGTQELACVAGECSIVDI